LGLGFFAGQFLEVFKAPALFFQQTVLPITDQVLIARRGRSRRTIECKASQQANAQQQPSPWQ
jgi:hypothetical protein